MMRIEKGQRVQCSAGFNKGRIGTVVTAASSEADKVEILFEQALFPVWVHGYFLEPVSEAPEAA